jgi:MFS family permease
VANYQIMKRRLPRTVLALGMVSLLTDLSSEMIYPLLPLFLSSVLAAGALSLGIIEGVAESTAALLKLISGIWSDRVSRRKPIVVAGYTLSGLVRPLIGLATVWPVVMALRLTDRIGKGLRGAPRDALIADVTTPDQRGTAYGLHRSMDHAGAVIGPLVAATLLFVLELTLKQVFLLTAIPAAVVVVVLVSGVREGPRSDVPAAALTTLTGWSRVDRRFKHLLFAIGIFTLGNSTDAFILLYLSDLGVSAVAIATLWSLHHVVKMIATAVGGRMADRFSRRALLACGWLWYAAVYAGFALLRSPPAVITLFLIYGVYFGLTEPVEKTLVAELAPKSLRGSAFGFLHATVGITALPASLLFGLLWYSFGAAAAFVTGAVLATVAALMLRPFIGKRSYEFDEAGAGGPLHASYDGGVRPRG